MKKVNNILIGYVVKDDKEDLLRVIEELNLLCDKNPDVRILITTNLHFKYENDNITIFHIGCNDLPTLSRFNYIALQDYSELNGGFEFVVQLNPEYKITSQLFKITPSELSRHSIITTNLLLRYRDYSYVIDYKYNKFSQGLIIHKDKIPFIGKYTKKELDSMAYNIEVPLLEIRL